MKTTNDYICGIDPMLKNMIKTFPASYETTYYACCEVVIEIGFSLEKSDIKSGEITAKTEATLLSWGEQIDIQITAAKNGGSTVEINSQAVFQIISWGKNNSNEEALISKLNDKLLA